MLVNPAATYGISQRLTRDAAERLARNWSMVLFSGALLIVSGVLILSIDWTVRSLATFVGALFIFFYLLLIYGILPNWWLQWCDGPLKWRADKTGIPLGSGSRAHDCKIRARASVASARPKSIYAFGDVAMQQSGNRLELTDRVNGAAKKKPRPLAATGAFG